MIYTATRIEAGASWHLDYKVLDLDVVSILRYFRDDDLSVQGDHFDLVCNAAGEVNEVVFTGPKSSGREGGKRHAYAYNKQPPETYDFWKGARDEFVRELQNSLDNHANPTWVYVTECSFYYHISSGTFRLQDITVKPPFRDQGYFKTVALRSIIKEARKRHIWYVSVEDILTERFKNSLKKMGWASTPGSYDDYTLEIR